MFNEGHELGRVTPAEIFGAALDALVYREYLDPHYTVPKTNKIIESDVNEPPWNRRVPGAVLYATPGERLYIHVLNGDKDDCHSFHLHGLRYGIDSDGAWPMGVMSKTGQRSDEILPGQSWTYVFDATPETVGAWAFHDHVRHVQRNVNRGLFGGLIVRDPCRPCVDHEIPLFVHQMEGASTTCQFESPTLTAGQSFSFTFTTPGTCNYHCLIHGIMMSGRVDVVAGASTAPQKVSMHNNTFDPGVVTLGPGGVVTWTNNENDANHNHIVFASGGGAANFCLNGRTYVGNTPTIVGESGERLRWYLFNLDLGANWHNFHPHSTRWQLPVPPGGASDVHSLSPVESFITDTEVPPAFRLPCLLEDLQCDPPESACRVRLKGDFLFHCHVEDHMMQGLAGLVRATEYVWLTEEVAKQLKIQLPYDDGQNDCSHVDVTRCSTRQPPRQPPFPPPVAIQSTGQQAAPGMAGETPMARTSGMGTLMPGVGGAGGTGAASEMPLMGDGNLDGATMDLSQAAEKGFWELLPCDSQVLAVHAALMHTGKVLFFTGSGNDPDKLAAHDFRSAVWDYQNGTFIRPSTPSDVFCAGQSFLPDGRLLVAGGTEQYDPFHGLKSAYLFDPFLEDWIRVQDMGGGRWYPTLITLGDGRIMAASGLGEDGNDNRTPEIYANAMNWSVLPASDKNWPLYPHLFLLRDGEIFYAGGNMGGNAGLAPLKLQVATNSVSAAVSGLTEPDNRDQSASVLLPPAQEQRVMIMGGGGGNPEMATAAVAIADFKAAVPAYTPAAPLHHARMHLNAVLLPDRTVFVSGGSGQGETVMTAVKESEIYHPSTGAWTEAATAKVPRLYHSVALLLPDGRVITAGSNPNRKDDELRLELFHPPYLFKGSRPFIESAPQEIVYGEIIEIHTPQADTIKWVHLIKPMATTHSCDTEQRLVDLPFRRDGFCTLKAHVPKDANLAPPGWYMLFVTNDEGIPSIAKWVRLKMDMQDASIKTVKIHPAIGVMRVGNSPSEFFIGPEIPGDRTPPPEGYKDAEGRIKRQGARFRLFGYDENNKLVKEITSNDASITWTVHLANKKAAWKQFDGLNPNAPLRNGDVQDRNSLIIDPGPRSLNDVNQAAAFDTGTFEGAVAPLGEMRTDNEGRLIVLGGFGGSNSPSGAPLTTFANNDGWHDDISDGPVTASVNLNGSTQTIDATGAWVTYGPPNFVPPLDHIITLYDTLLQVAVNNGWLTEPAQPSFTKDIYPILQRAMNMRWVSAMAANAHKTISAIFPPPGADAARLAIFNRLRDPKLLPTAPSDGDMPMIWSDYYVEGKNQPLTNMQYNILIMWKDGNFINDWMGVPQPPSDITPEGLDRAGIESCVGAAFFPGLEVSWLVRDEYSFLEPFRLDPAKLEPGDLTKQMAVPWQADFTDCVQDGDFAWWPAQRPDDVFPEAGGPQVPWVRDLIGSKEDMVALWHKLGFVVKKGDSYVETERTP